MKNVTLNTQSSYSCLCQFGLCASLSRYSPPFYHLPFSFFTALISTFCLTSDITSKIISSSISSNFSLTIINMVVKLLTNTTQHNLFLHHFAFSCYTSRTTQLIYYSLSQHFFQFTHFSPLLLVTMFLSNWHWPCCKKCPTKLTLT